MTTRNGEVAKERLQNDTTFRSYSSAQVKEYANRRGGYPVALINELISKHAETGGEFDSLLDLGCGPGNSTRDIAIHFDHAVGVDPGPGMVQAAQEIGGSSKTGLIEFLQGEAEVCEGVADNSVDMITAATSGHWFDMERFWHTADRVLKPGGTAAFFTIWRIFYHPVTVPEAKEIQDILVELEQGDAALGPFQKPGNWLLMGLYKDLQMPWSLKSPCGAFPESRYERKVFNAEGKPDANGKYMCGVRTLKLDDAAKGIATISAATRWREAHPQLADTEKDCVNGAFSRIRSILRERADQGAVPFGEEMISLVGPTVLVTVKKRV